MKNIILIGMPGSGKTAFGSALAGALGRPFYDADQVLEAREGRDIPFIFQTFGEERFRTMETEVLRELAAMEGIVLATGGGAVLRKENRDILKASGLVCWIDRTPERIMGDVAIEGRPLLAAGKERVRTLYKERLALYRETGTMAIANDGTFEEVLACMIRRIRPWL